MSRTNKGSKAPGCEYWKSRLAPHGEQPGPITKRLTHRKERRAGKEIERKETEVQNGATDERAFSELK